jgi:integrase
VRRIEDNDALETAHRTLSSCGQVFRYAVSTQRRQDDPTSFLRGALPPAKGSHLAAVTDPAKVPELLRAIDGYHGKSLVVRSAFRLAPLVFVRPGELRKAKWTEMHLDMQSDVSRRARKGRNLSCHCHGKQWKFCVKYSRSPAKGSLPFRTPGAARGL